MASTPVRSAERQEPEPPPRVIGVDPGTRIVGWGVLEKRGRLFVPIAAGAIKTDGLTDIPDRLERIYDELTGILQKYKPQVAGIETTFFDMTTPNAKSVIAMGQGRGIALLACKKAGAIIREYSPATVKQTVTGSGRADKEQVREMVMRLLGLRTKPKPYDVSDALAIALTAARQVRFTKRIMERVKRSN
jgi:crossover junction endodeoxyribonuclease RuvC